MRSKTTHAKCRSSWPASRDVRDTVSDVKIEHLILFLAGENAELDEVATEVAGRILAPTLVRVLEAGWVSVAMASDVGLSWLTDDDAVAVLRDPDVWTHSTGVVFGLEPGGYDELTRAIGAGEFDQGWMMTTPSHAGESGPNEDQPT